MPHSFLTDIIERARRDAAACLATLRENGLSAVVGTLVPSELAEASYAKSIANNLIVDSAAALAVYKAAFIEAWVEAEAGKK